MYMESEKVVIDVDENVAANSSGQQEGRAELQHGHHSVSIRAKKNAASLGRAAADVLSDSATSAASSEEFRDPPDPDQATIELPAQEW